MYCRILVLPDGSARAERILPKIEKMASFLGTTVPVVVLEAVRAL